MRGQRYRARDKTVQKMGRDGLVKENLRSGETARVSRRETDHLPLPRTADDSINFQNRRGRRADGQGKDENRRGGYSPDFKRPEDGRTADGKPAPYKSVPEESKFPLYRENSREKAVYEETAFPYYQEDTGETETEMAQETGQDQAPVLPPETEIRETGVRQEAAVSHRTSSRKRRYIPEPPTARYSHQRRNRMREASAWRTDFSDKAPENMTDKSMGMPIDTGQDVMPDGMPDMAQDAASDTVRIVSPSAAAEKRKMSARMYGRKERPFDQNFGQRNAGEKKSGEYSAGGEQRYSTGEGNHQDVSHSRKKKQVYTYARKMKEQKKVQEQKAASVRREEKRHTGNRLAAEEALKTSGENAEKSEWHWKRHKAQKKQAERFSFAKEGRGVHRADGRFAYRAVSLTAGIAASVLNGASQEEPEEDIETQVLRQTGRAGERSFRYALRPMSARMQKKNRPAGEETDRKKKINHFYQKQRNKKAYKKTKQKASAKGGQAEGTGTFLEKAKDVARDIFRDKKGILIAAAVILLFFLFFAAGFSGCSAMVQGTSTVFIGTTYPSRDADIYAAEDAYKALEEELDKRIKNMETAYPGYDEYRYQVDEITHNPYQLISFLTVLYEEFTYELVEEMAMLPVFFAEQYCLTVEEKTEIRTKMEPQTVTDPETGEETEEEVEVEYEWRILYVCLENKGFDTVARNHMTQDQAALYDAYNLTYGNRSYLFDVDALPADSPDGAGYEIPAEALSDVQFARMIQEAEKYLGYPYVWGGDSPQTGFDCSGFVCWVVNHCGNGWNVGRQTAEGLRGMCTVVSPSEAKPGDLVFFQGTYSTSGASHVGIYVGNGMMINAGSPIKYANINTPYWKGHFLSFGRIQ